MITNVHHRVLDATREQVGALVDSLASAGDRLWPTEAWPAMQFDRPLGVGAKGGHGPVRYSVIAHVPGESVVFRFDAPRGFDGTHRFDVRPMQSGTQLVHTLAMRARGPAIVSWPLVFRWLHDALLEDAMAKAQAQVGDRPEVVPWSPYVRLLRRLLSKGPPRGQVWYSGDGP